jgi:hypothetical protein
VTRALILLSTFAVLIFVTAFLPPILTAMIRRPNPSSMSLGEWLDLLTPILLIVTIVLLLHEVARNEANTQAIFPDALPLAIMLLGAILSVSGQGIHLPANSLSHFLTGERDGTVYQLNYFYDEVLSHYLWHGGGFILVLGLALFEIQHPFAGAEYHKIWLAIPILFFSFTYSFAALEGGTVRLILPLSCVSALGLLLLASKSQVSFGELLPIGLFATISFALITIVLTVYGLHFHGFPQPLDLLKWNGNAQ